MNQKKNRRPGRDKKAAQARTARRGSRAVREYTAGGVVFRRLGENRDQIEILMIQDRLGRWTIPKGHVEEGEKIEETALREVAEETGLHELKLGEKLDKIHFFYRKEGKLIFMTTFVFLMEAVGNSDALVPEDSEGIVDAKWFPRDEALRLIEYRDTERLFRLGLSKVDGTDRPKPRPRPQKKPFSGPRHKEITKSS